jgi:hypothetical protein
MKPKYEEGLDAAKKFERAMTALFQVKKLKSTKKIKEKPKKGKDYRAIN